MKKLFTLLLVSSMAMAADNVKSIVALEYGYLGTTNKSSKINNVTTPETGSLNTIGLKLGAAEGDYRLFLSYRLLQANTATATASVGHSGGAEFDYVLNFAQVFGLYFGVNSGYAAYKYTGSDSQERILSSVYLGGQGGAILTVGQFEIDTGVRYWYYLNGADATVTSLPYTIQDTTTFYASLHFFY